MELMIPWILSYILDYVVPQKNTRLVLFWGLLMVLSAIAALVGNILANRISASVARDTTRTLRHDLFKKISYLSSAQIDYFSIPSLEARLTTDSYNINQVIGMMQRLGIRAPILLIGGIAITMTLEPVLTWTMISVLPFIALVVWLVSRKGIPMYTDLQRGVDIMVRTVRENISGIRVIKALSKTEQEKEHFSQVNRDVVRCETKASVTMGITNPMMNLFFERWFDSGYCCRSLPYQRRKDTARYHHCFSVLLYHYSERYAFGYPYLCHVFQSECFCRTYL